LQSKLAAPKVYNEQSSKFYEAVRYLESMINRFTKEKEGKSDGS
jgi:hypothetical protein